jgi:HNH endonuclease
MPKNRVKRHAVTQPLDDSYRLIPLTQGQNAIVDATDFERLSQWNWCVYWTPSNRSFYALRYQYISKIGDKWIRREIYMAREILNCGSDEEVDHISHNTLDNRRANLRIVTRSQNMCNRRTSSASVSGFKGIVWSREKWEARITLNGKTKYLGRSVSAEKAARMYDEAAKKYHGEFAHLNFP